MLGTSTSQSTGRRKPATASRSSLPIYLVEDRLVRALFRVCTECESFWGGKLQILNLELGNLNGLGQAWAGGLLLDVCSSLKRYSCFTSCNRYQQKNTWGWQDFSQSWTWQGPATPPQPLQHLDCQVKTMAKTWINLGLLLLKSQSREDPTQPPWIVLDPKTLFVIPPSPPGWKRSCFVKHSFHW